ncbi:hypothetical protein E8E14_013439 [Neopestalotiopsis sp. 37M]|nr:hypothetical protein E8E14_013439 [Neopestalotiopsis sp. 37M]
MAPFTTYLHVLERETMALLEREMALLAGPGLPLLHAARLLLRVDEVCETAEDDPVDESILERCERLQSDCTRMAHAVRDRETTREVSIYKRCAEARRRRTVVKEDLDRIELAPQDSVACQMRTRKVRFAEPLVDSLPICLAIVAVTFSYPLKLLCSIGRPDHLCRGFSIRPKQ